MSHITERMTAITRWLVTAGTVAVTALASTSCADPFIESTTVLEDTTDAVGPYTVDTVILGTASGDRVEIRHSRPDRDDGVIVMTDLGDDGDGPGDLYRGEIPGQPVGTQIGYYVVLIRDEAIVDRDPPGDGVVGPRFNFSVTP